MRKLKYVKKSAKRKGDKRTGGQQLMEVKKKGAKRKEDKRTSGQHER